MKLIYIQDKRSRKHTPPLGTTKYPVYYLGLGSIKQGEIKVYGYFPFFVDPQKYRIYAVTKRTGRYLENISGISFDFYYTHVPENAT